MGLYVGVKLYFRHGNGSSAFCFDEVVCIVPAKRKTVTQNGKIVLASFGDGHDCERIADILEGREYSPWEPK